MRELRYGTEIDIGYDPDYRFSVRLIWTKETNARNEPIHSEDRKFQAYVRDLREQKDIPGPVFESCLDAEDFAEAWKEDYVRTGNIHCIEKAKI